jgi:hypothetical protein
LNPFCNQQTLDVGRPPNQVENGPLLLDAQRVSDLIRDVPSANPETPPASADARHLKECDWMRGRSFRSLCNMVRFGSQITTAVTRCGGWTWISEKSGCRIRVHRLVICDFAADVLNGTDQHRQQFTQVLSDGKPWLSFFA